MMYGAFKLDETISKQIYFWHARRTWEMWNEKKQPNIKLKVYTHPPHHPPKAENGTKPPAESQLT